MKAEHIPTKKHKVRRKANRKRLINIAIVCIVGFGAIHFSWRPVLSQYYQMKINRPVKQTEPKIKKGVLVDGMELKQIMRVLFLPLKVQTASINMNIPLMILILNSILMIQ